VTSSTTSPLEPDEQLDSDLIRNDDGDEVVDPPEQWIEAKDDESLDERLSEPISDDDLDHLDPEQRGRDRGQIDGTPEDGDSFFDVVE
jgi:hypothetical protein